MSTRRLLVIATVWLLCVVAWAFVPVSGIMLGWHPHINSAVGGWILLAAFFILLALYDMFLVGWIVPLGWALIRIAKTRLSQG
jgi:hypothetical protein